MEIKMCGITNIEDAIVACESQADAIGVIFYPKSPRYVAPDTVKTIIERLPLDITTVGVFVNHNFHEVNKIIDYCGLDLIQLHGDESPEYCRQFPTNTLIKALFPQTEEDLASLKFYPVKAILIDSREQGRYGGTGKRSNWILAAKAKEVHPLILAGGLSADNILEAIESVSPHAVDVNSGVEVSPGKKNHEKVKKIITMVRNIDRKHPTRVFSAKNELL